MTTSREWHLTRRPHGVPVDEDFALVDVELHDPGDGEILVRNSFLSVDPYMRGRMNDAKSYVPAFRLDQPMDGEAVGVVEQVGEAAVDSNGSAIAVGDRVIHRFGWRTTSLVPAKSARILDISLAPEQAYLGVLGMPGLTAYVGLLRIGQFVEGERLFVSSAAGAVGSMVGQLARLKGASLVVGSAGGPEKTAWLLDEAGFDAAIDYKSEDVRAALKEKCPDRINVYFDNVGGDILDSVLTRLARGARIAICGAVSQYNNEGAVKGPANYMALLVDRARMQGFVVFDYADRYIEAALEMAGWMAAGTLKTKEDIVDGLETFPDTLLKLFKGENLGKLIIKVADE